MLFCDNETNEARLFGAETSPPYPKDGINDHVVGGAPTVNPEQHGTKAAVWYQLTVDAGATTELRLRLRPGRFEAGKARLVGAGDQFDEVVSPPPAGGRRVLRRDDPGRAARPTTAMVMRQAFAGMLWSKQLYAYDVRRWLDGDPTQPTPPASRLDGAQLPLEELRRLRHHVDARQVGVPVVRGLGPGASTASRWPTSTRRSPSTSWS